MPSGLPGLPRQARNLAAAAARTLRAALAGRPIFVPPDVLKARESICATCEENLAGRCRKCGCGIRAQFLRKTHLATEHCPLTPSKWPEWPSKSASCDER
jgi:hypothetical protein